MRLADAAATARAWAALQPDDGRYATIVEWPPDGKNAAVWVTITGDNRTGSLAIYEDGTGDTTIVALIDGRQISTSTIPLAEAAEVKVALEELAFAVLRYREA